MELSIFFGGSLIAPGKYLHEVATPGPGEPAPTFYRQRADEANFNLADCRRKTVMLYFQEGGGYQPCWAQITGIEQNWAPFQRLSMEYPLEVEVMDSRSVQEQELAMRGRMRCPPGLLTDAQFFSSGRPSERKLPKQPEAGRAR